MKIWETKCHVWLDTETNRVKTLYKHTSQRHACKQTSKPLDRKRRELAVFFTPPFPLLHLALHPPSLHMCEMLSWKRLAALRVYKRRGFVQFLSFAFRLLKQNKASWRKRTWEREREKWKLIIFLHVLPFISLHMNLCVLISSLSPVMTRFTISHFDNKYQDEGESLVHSKTYEWGIRYTQTQSNLLY